MEEGAGQSGDTRIRFLLEDLAVRGELVRLRETTSAVMSAHEYPSTVSDLVGEALAAVALLAGTLKIQGQLSLQARGEGPLQLLLAECAHGGDLRAIARWDGDVDDAPLVSLLGEGSLAITIEPAGGKRYQGIVPLDGSSLAECIEHYFAQSEQLGTRLWLVTDGYAATAGLMLQEIPSAPGTERDRDGWNRLCRLTDTLTGEELLDLDPSSLLWRLYHDEVVRVFDPEPLRFHCSCSTERMREALRALGEPELRGILEEQHGEIETVCQFCNRHRRFSAADLFGG